MSKAPLNTSIKLPKTLSGVAGEYFVAGELSRRGYIASVTLRNTRGVDILAASSDVSKSVGIQVKTNQNSVRLWMMNEKAEAIVSEDLFYVFVNLNGGSGQPTYHVVSSEVVANYCQISHAEWLAETGRKGQTRNDTPMRKFSDKECIYLDAWHLLGLWRYYRFNSLNLSFSFAFALIYNILKFLCNLPLDWFLFPKFLP